MARSEEAIPHPRDFAVPIEFQEMPTTADDLVDQLVTHLQAHGSASARTSHGGSAVVVWLTVARRAAYTIGRPLSTGIYENDMGTWIGAWAALSDWPADQDETLIHQHNLHQLAITKATNSHRAKHHDAARYVAWRSEHGIVPTDSRRTPAALSKEPVMAQKVNITLVDDIDGSEADETVTFALDGTTYEIDLNAKHAKALRDELAGYVGYARKVSSSKRASSRKATSSSDGPSAAEVRAWAQSNGHDVPERGRIPASVREAFDAAN